MLSTVEDLSGWKALEEEDLLELKDRIAKTPSSAEPTVVKKEPLDSSKAAFKSKKKATTAVDDTNALREQTQFIWSKKDWLHEQLAGYSAKASKQLLVEIFHTSPCMLDSKSVAELVDALVDYLCFGVPKMVCSRMHDA